MMLFFNILVGENGFLIFLTYLVISCYDPPDEDSFIITINDPRGEACGERNDANAVAGLRRAEATARATLKSRLLFVQYFSYVTFCSDKR